MSHESELMQALAEELDRLRGGLAERRGRVSGPTGGSGFDPAAPLLSIEAFRRLSTRSLREHARSHHWLAVVVVRPDDRIEPLTLPGGPVHLDLAVWDRIGALRLRHALRVDDPVSDHGPGTLVCLIPDLRHEADARSVCLRLERHLGQAVGRITGAESRGALENEDGASDDSLCATGPDAMQAGPARHEQVIAPSTSATTRLWQVSPRVGMACFPRDGDSIEALLAVAEAQLDTVRRHMEAPPGALMQPPSRHRSDPRSQVRAEPHPSMRTAAEALSAIVAAG